MASTLRIGRRFRLGKIPLAGSIDRCLLAFSATACVVSCGDEDRVLIAKCSAPDRMFAAAFSAPDVNSVDARIGRFNGRQDQLGTMFHMVPGNGNGNNARWIPFHKLGALAQNESHSDIWFIKLVHARLSVAVDSDAERFDRSSRTKIELALGSGTQMAVTDVHRRTISDVLSAINNDPTALDGLRVGARQDRYFVVSSIADSNAGYLFYDLLRSFPTPSKPSTAFVGAQTIRLGSTYFHVNYSCPPFLQAGSEEGSTTPRTSAFYIYTAVRYDEATKRAQLDLHPVDVDSTGFTL